MRDAKLTKRQRQITSLLGLGLGNRGIAARLGISINTVKAHLKKISVLLRVHSRAGIVRQRRERVDRPRTKD